VLIRGWDVREDDGLFIAVRRAPLSEYQKRYGALAQVDSREDGELYLLVDAQSRLADLLATAESVAVFARRRRQECALSESPAP